MIVAASVLGVIVLSVIIYVATDKGRIKIIVEGPTLAIKIDHDEVRIDGLGEPITLRSGEHNLTVIRENTEIERKFIVRRWHDGPCGLNTSRDPRRKNHQIRRELMMKVLLKGETR